MTITEAMLMAYADGELNEADRRAVDEAVAQDPALAAALARHQTLRLTLAAAFNPVLEEPVPQALLTAVSRSPEQAPVSQPFKVWLPLAACLMLGLMVGVGLPRPKALIGNDMHAQGALDKALETQTAADQGGGVVRVGLTLHAKDGSGYCRTFQTRAAAGFACRDPRGWRVQMAAPDQSAIGGDFRTAAGLPAAIMDQVQAQTIGDPLDAAGEKAALAAHWRP